MTVHPPPQLSDTGAIDSDDPQSVGTTDRVACGTSVCRFVWSEPSILYRVTVRSSVGCSVWKFGHGAGKPIAAQVTFDVRVNLCI